jgi:hypothetical protein
MRHLTRLLSILAFGALLAGCQTGLPGSGAAPGDGVTANAVTGDAIEVTALDAPAGDPATDLATGALPPKAPATAAAQEATPVLAETEPSDPAPQPELAADATKTPAEPAAEAKPQAPKSEAQIACEKKRGQWLSTGVGQLRTCIFTTRDGGKRCTRESDCEGACLARSGTCSPIRPLLGCNEILQDNGARVTLCVE